jgi:AraC-like DNA-binding protein
VAKGIAGSSPRGAAFSLGEATPAPAVVSMGLVADGFGLAADGAPLRQAGRLAAVMSAKRYIERHLDSPRLSAAQICLRFGWSRATLYRLFEPESGLVNYIQRRRLHRAFSALVSPVQSHRRILDMALDSHFASDATFNRAFRRLFGIPPGELRDLARARSVEQGDWPTPALTHGGDVLHMRWIRELGISPMATTRGGA